MDVFDKNILKSEEVPTNINTKKQFKDNYFKLLANKKWYADSIGVPFMMFEYDLRYQKFELEIKKHYPFITTYNIVNFYKLKLLCELAQTYDEILYLDFDVVCLTKDNFFGNWD